MIAFLKVLEIYDAWFARSSLLFMGACLFHIRKNISSNLAQDVIFSFAKTYFHSSLNLTERPQSFSWCQWNNLNQTQRYYFWNFIFSKNRFFTVYNFSYPSPETEKNDCRKIH